MPYQGPFPQEPPCRMPCPHNDYVRTVRALLTMGKASDITLARVIVDRNSEGEHPTPHDWSQDLTMDERLKLNAVETAETIF